MPTEIRAPYYQDLLRILSAEDPALLQALTEDLRTLQAYRVIRLSELEGGDDSLQEVEARMVAHADKLLAEDPSLNVALC